MDRRCRQDLFPIFPWKAAKVYGFHVAIQKILGHRAVPQGGLGWICQTFFEDHNRLRFVSLISSHVTIPLENLELCYFLHSSSSSSSSLPKGVGDHVPPQLSVLRLCDQIHCSFFSCPFSDTVKNLFSWSSSRSFSQYSRRCYQVFQSLSSHGVPKKVCLLFSYFAFKC